MLWHARSLKYIVETGEEALRHRERVAELARKLEENRAQALLVIERRRAGKYHVMKSIGMEGTK